MLTRVFVLVRCTSRVGRPTVARGSAAQISSTDRDRRRGMSSGKFRFGGLYLGNLVLDFATYSASAPQKYFGGSLYEPRIMLYIA